MGELDALLKLAEIPRDKLCALCMSLFEGTAPEVEKWSDRKIVAFLGGYLEYFKHRTQTEKKLDPVAQAIATVQAVLAKAPA